MKGAGLTACSFFVIMNPGSCYVKMDEITPFIDIFHIFEYNISPLQGLFLKRNQMRMF